MCGTQETPSFQCLKCFVGCAGRESRVLPQGFAETLARACGGLKPTGVSEAGLCRVEDRAGYKMDQESRLRSRSHKTGVGRFVRPNTTCLELAYEKRSGQGWLISGVHVCIYAIHGVFGVLYQDS